MSTSTMATKANRDWEATFSSWGATPGATEQTKCENAEPAVRKAISASTKLSSKSIDVFTQGSYANCTNVRQGSDVDICVLYTGAFFPDYQYLTLVYQIDLGVTRLLWIGKKRTIESFQGFFTAMGKDVISKIAFVCSDKWEPYLETHS